MVRDRSMRLQPPRRLSEYPAPVAVVVRAYRLTLAAWHRWCIASTTDYLRACERDGLTDSLSLREFRNQIQQHRLRVIDLTTRD